MILTEQITALQTQLATAQGQAQQNFADLTQARADLDTARVSITTLTTERDTLTASLATVTGERDTAVSDLQAERAGRATAIDTEVTRRIAAAGGEPIRRDPNATTAETTPGVPTGNAASRLAATIKIAG